ncbi:unnamed protein product [Blepharisma stoltei]|uniref:Uncharacterized protein n=1 Tax=Blepharisma stoltei TaxID=1481888 RepID=A0AAU9IRL2_9CILI|nr:unnamed protein product [Blepharisma stoltei]
MFKNSEKTSGSNKWICQHLKKSRSSKMILNPCSTMSKQRTSLIPSALWSWTISLSKADWIIDAHWSGTSRLKNSQKCGKVLCQKVLSIINSKLSVVNRFCQ